MDLFVGGNSRRIHGEIVDLNGLRCFSAYYSPLRHGEDSLDPLRLCVLGDSGAFQDVKESDRITPEQSLERQFKYEQKLSSVWGVDWRFHAISSYDRLIDEKWINDCKVKQRWSEDEAWSAVKETVAGAQYLDKQRNYLGDRVVVLGCQGVTARQYRKCVDEVLEVAKEGDWIGLGGWCILGKNPSWFNTFKQTLLDVIPSISNSPVKHVHLYGVLWLPALGAYQAICDEYGLTCSTDSKKPLSDCRWKTVEQRVKAGARRHHWRENVEWWQQTLANLQSTKYYKSPSAQLDIFLDAS